MGNAYESPQVAIDPEGNATAVWERREGINEPQIAVDPQGTATVVWTFGTGAGGIIQAATSVWGRAYAARVIRVKGGRASITVRCGQGGRCGGAIR